MSTKVRFRQETKARGQMVLETPPQMRTIFPGHGKPVSVPFPYLIHIINYGIDGKNYTYYGVYDKGLCVFLATEPLASLDTLLCYSPTDMERSGLVCTNHAYDRRSYLSARELANDVLGVWSGMIHNIRHDDLEKWKKLTVANTCKYSWQNAFTLRAALEWDAVHAQGFGNYGGKAKEGLLTVPAKCALINEELNDVPAIGDLDE